MIHARRSRPGAPDVTRRTPFVPIVAGPLLLCLLTTLGSLPSRAQPPLPKETSGGPKLPAPPLPDSPPAFVVDRLTATGIFPMKGQELGQIYSSPPGCSPADAAALIESPPMAAPIGEQIEVTVHFKSCSVASSKTPKVSCGWNLRNKRFTSSNCRLPSKVDHSGKTSWTGLSGKIPLVVPPETGSYELSLDCSFDGEEGPPIPFRSFLYATLGPPLEVISPPKARWYEMATCWGGGFDVKSDEVGLLQTLLAGLYHHGSRHWRYGYAHETDDGKRFFRTNNRVEPVLAPDDELLCFSSTKRCKCIWQAMLDEKSQCRFSDCYMFSNTFQFISATLGIPGVNFCDACQVKGANSSGFSTHPSARSLDPRFPGNISCDNKSVICPSYLFSSHSIMARDNIFYDATFNLMYDSVAGPIYMNVKSDEEMVTFLNNPSVLIEGPEGYGTWNFLRYPDLTLTRAPDSGLPVDQTRSALFSEGAAFPGLESAVDRESSEPLQKVLNVALNVDVQRKGAYIVLASLYKDDEFVTNRPIWDSSFRTMQLVGGFGSTLPRPIEKGNYSVTVTFSGEAIRRHGGDGVYQVRLRLAGLDGLAHLYSVDTPHLSSRDFGEQAAELEASEKCCKRAIEGVPDLCVEAVEGPGGETSGLKVTTGWSIQDAGEYVSQLRLAKDGQTITHSGKRMQLDEGVQCVEMTIPGPAIRDSGLDSPYALTVELFDDLPDSMGTAAKVLTGLEASSFD